MVITVEDIFKDVISNFPVSAEGFDSKKILNYINQTYIKVRDKYIENGQGEEFAISQTLSSFSASNFNYFSKATLTRDILQSLPLDTAVVTTFIRTVPELTDPYTLSKIFDPEDVRNYRSGNGLKYFEGDVVFEGDIAYRANETIIATSTDALADQDEWEDVYWMKKGIGMVNAEVIDYHRVDRHKLAIDAGSAVVTVLKDTLFVSKNINSITLEYLPEHTDVTALDDTLIIPDGSRKAIRDMVVSEMLRTLPRTESEEDANK